jgi:hypothetical protein
MSRFSLGRTTLLLTGTLAALAIFSSSAVASGPPIVTIGSSTNHSLNTAVINGTVDKNGANATYKLEYGKTKLYGSSTSATNLNTSGTVPISSLLVGLSPSTTYHVRISATNSFGTTVSEDLAFEMLLQWKVAGKTLEQFEAEHELRPFYEDYKGDGTLTAEGVTRTGTKVKVACENGPGYYYGEYLAEGILGSTYHQSFAICQTYINGIVNANCKPPTPFKLELNGVMVPVAGTKFNLGEECSVGSAMDLTKGGFEVGATPEASRHVLTLTEHLDAWGTTVTYQTPELQVFAGIWPFGIS